MYIEKISIKSFGALRDYECDFSKGINVIEGPNESGKSTVGAFIKFVFFGLSAFSDGNLISERKKYQSWEDGSAGGSIELVCKEKKYRIERSIIPALNGFGREIVKTVDLESGEEILKDTEPGAYFFGVSGDVFAQSAYVSQTAGTLVNGVTVNEAIENMLFSGNELISTQQAQTDLDKARNQLLYRNKKGGVIYDLGIEKDAIAKKIEKASADNLACMSLGAALKALREKMKGTEEELLQKKNVTKACKGRRIIARFEAYEEKKQALDAHTKAFEEYKESNSHEGFLPDAEYVSQLESLEREIAVYEAELEKAKQSRDELGKDKIDADDLALLNKANEDGGQEAISEFFENTHKSVKNSVTMGVFFSVFALLWGAMSGVCIFVKELSSIAVGPMSLKNIGLIAAGVAALMIVLAIVFFIRSQSFSKKIDKKLDYYNATGEEDIYTEITAASNRAKDQEIYLDKLMAADAECQRIEGQITSRREKAKELCSKWGKDELQTAEVIALAGEVIAKLSEEDKLISSEEASCTATEQSLEGLDREEAQRAVELSAEEIDAQQEAELEKQIAELEGEREQTDTQIRQSETELARLEAGAADVSELLDRYDELCAKIEKLTKRYDSLTLALETLKRAEEALRAEVSPRLSMQASEYMRRATSDKYGSLSISSELGIKYGETSGGVSYTSRECDYLSQGTKDLAYVSLRLALVGFLYKKELPPLVFDEAFSHLDDKRLAGMFNVIRDYAENSGQVFVFTSQKRDAEIMRRNANAKYIRMGY